LFLFPSAYLGDIYRGSCAPAQLWYCKADQSKPLQSPSCSSHLPELAPVDDVPMYLGTARAGKLGVEGEVRAGRAADSHSTEESRACPSAVTRVRHSPAIADTSIAMR